MATGCQRSQQLIKLAARMTKFIIIRHNNREQKQTQTLTGQKEKVKVKRHNTEHGQVTSLAVISNKQHNT